MAPIRLGRVGVCVSQVSFILLIATHRPSQRVISGSLHRQTSDSGLHPQDLGFAHDVHE